MKMRNRFAQSEINSYLCTRKQKHTATMTQQRLLETQILLLQSALHNMRVLRDEGVDLTASIVPAESKLHEMLKQAGWHSVSLIMNGSATESIFFGTHEECKKFVSDWLKDNPEDKGNLIISPL